jgi:hypothetical protein
MNDVMEKFRFVLELQNYADEKINFNWKPSYPEMLSFSVTGTIGVPRNNNIYSEQVLEMDSGHVLEMNSGTELTTAKKINIGLTYPSLNSDITSQKCLHGHHLL